jgi:hypothetical protein
MKKSVAAFRFNPDTDSLADGTATSVSIQEVQQLPDPAIRPKTARAPSRIGKKNVNFCLSEAAWEQLSILSVRTRRPIQDLMCEATDHLFQANGLSRIAKR